MKYLYIKLAVLCVILAAVLVGLNGCKDYLQPEPYDLGDENPPALVTATYESFSGGARINFQLPEGRDDLLYVKATYIRNGRPAEAKVSRYVNHIDVVGLTNTEEEVTVTLVVGSSSSKESEPYLIDVRPLEAPINVALNSALIEKTFGGIRLRWENPTQATTVVKVFSFSNLNYNPNLEPGEEPLEPDWQWVQVLSDDTRRLDPDYKVRGEDIGGYPAIPTDFKIVFHDTYGNVSDTIRTNKTPMPEQIIEPQLPGFWVFAGEDVHHADLAAEDPTLTWDGPHWRHRDNTYLWNGKWKTNNDAYWATGNDCGGPQRFLNRKSMFVTMDFKEPFFLSRYHLRNIDNKQFVWNETSVKAWRVWACRATTEEEAMIWGPNSQWEVIDQGEVDEPTMGLTSHSVAEIDYEYWKAGWEKDISNNLDYPVRYLRLEVYENWQGTVAGANVGEFRVYGNPASAENSGDE
ncbi:DUF4959 domain-containing protein [Prolixibacteraceae bacterium JC049]|nr:DUF4959 domain-containing protein [Prolixibacteraceae bacterium JC049]